MILYQTENISEVQAVKIAVVEDEQVHFDLLSGYIKNWADDKGIKVIISHYISAESFLFQWDEEACFDALFADIQMQAMNGMDMAKKIRETDKNISIVFTTGIADYIEEGYEVEAMHYLIKPIKEIKVRECLDKISERKKPEIFVIVHSQDDIIKVAADEINYVEAMGHGSVIGLYDKKIEVKESISELEQMFDKKMFIKCHRSYICNIANINHIDKANIYFDNEDSIPVSRRLYGDVNKSFISYFRRIDK